VEEVTSGRRMLNNKKLYDVSFCRQTIDEKENCIQDFGGKKMKERNRLRRRFILEANFDICLRGVGWKNMD
jgi:hypothetical protein